MPVGERDLLLTLRSIARTKKEKLLACGVDKWAEDSTTCNRLRKRLEGRGIKTRIENSDILVYKND